MILLSSNRRASASEVLLFSMVGGCRRTSFDVRDGLPLPCLVFGNKKESQKSIAVRNSKAQAGEVGQKKHHTQPDRRKEEREHAQPERHQGGNHVAPKAVYA